MATGLSKLLVIGAALVALGSAAAAQDVPEPLQSFVPVTDEMLLQPKPENWLSFRNGYRLWGYSELDQINAENVGELRLVWVAGDAGGLSGGRAARIRRHHVSRQRRGYRAGARRHHGRPAVGVPPQPAGQPLET